MSLVRTTFVSNLVLAVALTAAAAAQPAVRPMDGSSARALEPLETAPRSLSPMLTATKADTLGSVAQLKLGALDRAVVDAEDLAVDKLEPQPYRISISREVFLSPDSSGTWNQIEDDRMLWRLRITAAKATSLSFHFDRFFLPPSGELLIYAADESRWIRPFTAADNPAAGQFWTPLLEADDVVLELTIDEAERGLLELSLAKVFHGYRGPGAVRFEDEGQLLKSGACNIDVACPQGSAWTNQIRSVARIMFEVPGGTGFCSGALVNNTAQNRRPYFLTANHCVASNSRAASVVAHFNYQNAGCRAPGSGASGGNGNGALNQFVTGSTLRATYAVSDFTLLELNSNPQAAWNPYWAGWSRSSANPPLGVSIHHPNGDEKRISFENDPLTTTAFGNDSAGSGANYLRVADWDAGTTEGGSSGSPLFDQNKRIVGQLSGGLAACGNNDPDWYGRFSADWAGGGQASNRLSDWLDPLGAGNSVLNGVAAGTTAPTPAAPSNLFAATISSTVVNLTWNDNSNNETEFRVESRPVGGTFVDIGPVDANSTGAQVFNLTPATAYQFRVRARNAAGNSAYSNIAAATTFGIAQPCVEGPNTMCLLNNRFKVQATFLTNQGASGQARAVELTPDTGYFWFFTQENVELVVKLRNACVAPFNRFWVFAGGLTNVSVNLTVTDSQTGAVQIYRNPQSTPFQPIQDTSAFATCP